MATAPDSTLDKLAEKLLAKVSPEGAENLDFLKNENAVQLNENYLPARLKYNTENKSLLNIFRGILKNSHN